MTYSQLITQLSKNTGYTKRELRTVLRNLAKIISETLCSGQPVQWDSVGLFFNAPEGAHHVRNYKTGERYWTKPRRRVKYKPSTGLRNSVRRSIELFKEEEPTERYLPKEKAHGKVRS
jgi:nucleoid DNA-binding protein